MSSLPTPTIANRGTRARKRRLLVVALAVANAAVAVIEPGAPIGPLLAGVRAALALSLAGAALALVDARRRDAQQRELASKQLEHLREDVNDILLLVAPDGSIVQTNDRALQAYGYTQEEMLRLDIRDLRAPATRAAVAEHMRRTVDERGLRFKTVHLKRDGSAFPVEVSSRPIRVGGTTILQSVVRDLTEEHAARAALAYQATLLDNLYDAVVGLDADLVVTAWNRAATRIFGWTAEEATGRSLREILPSEFSDGATFDAIGARAARNGHISVEARRKTRAGQWIDVEVRVVALRSPDGALIGFVSVNRDISLQKRAQALLRDSQERLRHILEAVNEAICVVDTSGRTEYANARVAELFGVSADELIGRPLADVLPEEARGELATIAGGGRVQREFRVVRPDGTEACLAFSRSPLHGADGAVTGAVEVFMDVTAARQRQEQQLHSQKLEAIGRIASGVAHDFNNLLSVILANARFLADAHPEDDPRRADAIEILQVGQRAAHLVRQLLAFGRREPPRAIPLQLNDVVAGVESLVRRVVGGDVRVGISYAQAPWPTLADPSQLEHVLMNLCVNARDAMPGGGELHISTSNVRVTAPPEGCRELRPGRHAVLSVADTGCGMSPDVLSRIFEPFFTTKARGHGTGLGLSTVYGLVEQMGGKIAVTSKPGMGTRFDLYFPVARETRSGVRDAA